ncbi:Ldh family oxidoreductase [Ancylobacter oerskovii]|uniref:Ldh family oxidoreductase n=1 Tax=Ancylobacter oerskovii TaxID=459519 RepID=A0ABW4YY97_9HYPH|nr:Ldh family oxidoreductase [Ancylobacter oerskovii]MBS7541707.1 Ldh family oxidoreductase [Ancylobacter oerskovii]
MSDKILIEAGELRRFAEAVLRAAGMREAPAVRVADTLIYADLRGVGSHGVARLSSYLDRVRAGVMALDPEMAVVSEAPASVLLDAGNGFGQLAGLRAMELAVAKARETGAGVVGVANSNHFGVAAYFAEQAVKAGMVGMVLTNSSPAMTPYNARIPLVGTNPIAFGVPAGRHRPIILDMSTSIVARGKIRLAARSGAQIPAGWAVDADGNPTQDARAAMKGSLAPIGGPKGAGLSLIIDLLTGVLTGTGLTGEVRNISDVAGPSRTGHLFVAIDVARFMPLDIFRERVDSVIAGIKAMPSVDGGPIFLPGEMEARGAEARGEAGIALSADVAADLAALGGRYGLALPGGRPQERRQAAGGL